MRTQQLAAPNGAARPTTAVILGVLLLALAACSPQKAPQTTAEYVQWFEAEDHGYLAEKCFRGFCFRAQLQPKELLVANQLRNKTTAATADLEALESAYENGQHVRLQLQRDAESEQKGLDLPALISSDYSEYASNTEYLAFDLKSNAMLVRDADTVKAIGYHYERSFGMGHPETFVFVFPEFEQAGNSPLRFVFDDPVLGCGRIKFGFTPDQVPPLPQPISASAPELVAQQQTNPN